MANKFDITQYDDRYFKWHRDHTRNYAIKNMDWYIKKFKPHSIIDYGCGIGAYLEAALANKITKIKGFDIGGDYVKKYTEKSVQPYIEYVDCTLQMSTGAYDCAISLETGEHIEPSASDQFVSNIASSTKKTGTILFSAAQPGQNGTGHINCQTKDFWKEKFKAHHFVCDQALTLLISREWSVQKAPEYIVNNLIVFTHQ